MLVKLFGGFLAVSTVSLCGIQVVNWAGRDTPDSLGAAALQGNERAALDLAAQGPEGVKQMRRVLETSTEPDVRSAMLDGLAAQRDWDSVPAFIAGLTDEDARVRGRAAAACNAMFGIDFQLRPDADPQRRARIIDAIRQAYEIHLNPPQVQEVE